MFVFALDVLRSGPLELPFVHHLGNVLDRHHLSFEHGKNLRQRHRAYLHVAQRKLLPRDTPREIVHQFFFTHGEPFDDAPFLPLERFAFEYLRDAPPQKIDSRLRVFLERVGLPAGQGQQARPVRQFEIVDVAAVERLFGRRVELLDHPRDGAATAGSRQAAHKHVVPGRGKLHSHFQRAQSALLADEPFTQLRLRRCLERDPRQLARPAQLCRGKLGWFRGRLGCHQILSSALL